MLTSARSKTTKVQDDALSVVNTVGRFRLCELRTAGFLQHALHGKIFEFTLNHHHICPKVWKVRRFINLFESKSGRARRRGRRPPLFRRACWAPPDLSRIFPDFSRIYPNLNYSHKKTLELLTQKPTSMSLEKKKIDNFSETRSEVDLLQPGRCCINCIVSLLSALPAAIRAIFIGQYIRACVSTL